MRQLSRRFAASGSDGDRYIVCLWAKFADTRGSEPGQPFTLVGSYLETSDGRALGYLGKGVYQVLDTMVILRTSDPAAP